MLEIFVGIISGVISGIGMGGGAILILILSIFMKVNQHIAQATNLIFFIPTSIITIIVTMKEKLINWRVGIPISIFGVVGAILGAKLSMNMDVNHLKKYFGIFLLLITLYEIYSFKKQYKNKDESK